MTNRRMMVAVLLAALSISGCKKEDNKDDDKKEQTETYKHIVGLSLPTIDSYPFHILTDVESGSADIANSQEIPDLPYGVMVTSQSGFVYLNFEEKIVKFSINDEGILENQGALQNTGISGGPVSAFLDDNRMLVSTGPRQAGDGVFTYQIISTSDMTEESTGTITLPVNDSSLAIPCSYILRDGKIFVPYIHSDEDYVAHDQAPVAIFNASNMEYIKTIYTDHTAALGYSVVSSHGIAENGDLYITSCNSDYWGVNEDLPSGIVRIKSGQDEFDDSYFFNLTEKLNGNHTGGMLYVANNKAIVQVFRSDLITAYGDYQGGFVIEYHLVDLEAKTTTKLNIPLCKWPRKTMTLLKNGKAAIAANTQGGNSIYIYDPADGSVTEGLKYEGAEFIHAFMTFE